MIHGIPLPIIAAVLSAVIGAAGAWTVQGWRIESVRAEYATKQFQALEKAHAETILLQGKADKAAADHAARASKMADAASRARATASGLRGDLAALLMSYSSEPSADYKTVSGLLAECGERYTSMAGEADKRASEVILLLEAWPK